MSKKIILIILAVIMVTSLISCKENNPADSGLLPEDTEKEDIVVEGDISVTYPTQIEEEQEAFSDFINAFEKKYPKTNVTVEYSSSSNISALISSGEIGDAFLVYDSEVYNYAITNKALMRLDHYMEILEVDLENVYSGYLNLGSCDGKQYMIPKESGTIVMCYNKDALDETGLEVPSNGWTWDTFLSYCRQLTKVDEYGDYVRIGAMMDVTWSPVFITFLEGWGGEWYDTETKTIKLTSDENVIKGFTQLVQAIELGYIKPVDISMGDNLDSRYANLEEKDCVFRNVVHSQLLAYGDYYDARQIEWDICTWPLGPDPVVSGGGGGLAVYNRSSNTMGAAALCCFLISEEGQTALNGGEYGGSIPVRSDLVDAGAWRYEDEEWSDKNFDAFVAVNEYVTVAQVSNKVPPVVAGILSGSAIKSVLENHFKGRADYTDGLEAIEEMANLAWQKVL